MQKDYKTEQKERTIQLKQRREEKMGRLREGLEGL
jgi:hypothetical protein